MLLLEKLNIQAVGLSLEAEPGALYNKVEQSLISPSEVGDIRDIRQIERVLREYNPSAIIHLAAQPLVLESYKIPLQTFETNVMGTANILEASRNMSSIKSIVVSTTDKVYENGNLGIPFKEIDPLKGKDPYSASKVGTESVVSAWQKISQLEDGASLISVRSGNVIGGGDFAKDRIIPDLIRAISKKEVPFLRNPDSIRPWQHVLDPLFGYLLSLEYGLAERRYESFNFGPSSLGLTVKELARLILREWDMEELGIGTPSGEENREAIVLNLDSTKSRKSLSWKPIWGQEEAIIRTSIWWKNVLQDKKDYFQATLTDIEIYIQSTN
jgi:CDP-glucose 4,6-dehydratase